MKPETVHKSFSLERAGLLMRNRLVEDMNAVLIVLGVSAGLNILSLILGRPAFFNIPFRGSAGSIWSVLVCLGGVLLAGRAFQQMHDGRGGSDWILLPATPLEKYAAAFASYALVWPVLASSAAFGLSALLEGLALVLKAPRGVIFNPLAGLDGTGVTTYVLFAAFALAASARFPKLPLVKTGAIATAWGIAFALLFLGGLLVSTPEGRQTLAQRHAAFDFRCGPGGVDNPVLEWLARISVYVSGVFAVVYGYFRVSEKEAVDEVQ